jgi:hypothetical protein
MAEFETLKVDKLRPTQSHSVQCHSLGRHGLILFEPNPIPSLLF